MCPLYPVHLVFTYGAIVVAGWILVGTSVTQAASQGRRLLTPLLRVNNSLLSTLALTEGEEQLVTLYLDDIPEDYVGELLLQIISPDGLEHLQIYPNVFSINNNVTSTAKPINFEISEHYENSTLSSLTNSENIMEGSENPTLDSSNFENVGIMSSNNNSTAKQNDNLEGPEALASVSNKYPPLEEAESRPRYFSGTFKASGLFVGFSSVKFILSDGNDEELMQSEPVLVKVDRGKHVLDKVFVHIIILLVIVVYINMGCAIDVDQIKETFRRPVAPLIGLFTQYLFMPLCAYCLGYMFLSDTPSLWLGLFVTGCSPGGGGSNMWTYLLGGSLDLSVTMTFVSTIAAFAMMPMWLLALAPTIFQDGYFGHLPYRNIGMLVLGLVVPICIGLGIRRCCPKGAALLKKMLKPLSLFFLLFVMTFGVYVYWFIFKFFTWKVAVCGLALPWLGFMFGGGAALVCKRSVKETIAISIETGLQNTGLAIGLLKLSLSSFSPMGDIAMVVPVAVATLTPVPLLAALLVKVYKDWRCGRGKHELVELSENSC